jgi:hypothetical protein
VSTNDDTDQAPKYLPGERVRITFDATFTGEDTDDGLLAQRDGFNAGYNFLIPRDATLERACPADGEPQPGELWCDRHGYAWFVRDGGRMVSTTGRDFPWTVVNADEGPLTLVYRPGPSVDHLPAAEPAEAVA